MSQKFVRYNFVLELTLLSYIFRLCLRGKERMSTIRDFCKYNLYIGFQNVRRHQVTK